MKSRMVKKEDVFWADLVMCNIAEPSCQVFKQMNRIVRTELAEGEPEKVVLESRRKTILRRFTLSK